MKSVIRGNAGHEVPAGGTGVVPVVAGDDTYRDVGGPGGGDQDAARVPLRELMDDRLLDALLER